MMDNQTFELLMMAAKGTGKHARQNIDNWGLGDLKTLIVSASEKLGETAKEVLGYEQNVKDDRASRLAASLDRIHREAQDFAAVGLQIMVLVDKLKGDFESEVK